MMELANILQFEFTDGELLTECPDRLKCHIGTGVLKVSHRVKIPLV